MSTPRPYLASVAISLLAIQAAIAQSFAVTAVTPSRNSNLSSTADPVELTFSAAVNPATVTSASIKVAGRWSGDVSGTLTVGPGSNHVVFQPARPYFPGENVTVRVASSVHSATGAALTGGFFSHFWGRPAPGTAAFSLQQTIALRQPGEGLIATYGVFGGDVDRDGSPDITAPNEVAHDIRVLHNDGCGTFGPMTIVPAPGQEPSPNEGGDFNGDGWMDLVTGNQGGGAISIYLGNGSGGFLPPVTYPTGGYTHGVAVLDFDGDGDQDVVAANNSAIIPFANDGTGAFTQLLSISSGGVSPDNVSVADANNDGKPDLFVGNLGSGSVTVLLGNGAGGFTISVTRACGGGPFQNATGDLNGDGNVDVVTANRGTNTLGVMLGNGAGSLGAATTFGVGNLPAAVDLADLDGDGDLDCVVSNYGSSNYTVRFNTGAGAFGPPTTLPSTSAGSCTTLVDLDRDGDVDIIATDEIADQARLYVQNGPNTPGAQPPDCGATLRINNWAGRAGFGTAAPRPVRVGIPVFPGVTAHANSPYAIAVGIASSPGIAVGPGLINLNLSASPIFIVNGFAGGPSGIANSNGEGLETILVPATVPTGATITLQAVVSDPTIAGGLRMSNPETTVFVP